MVSSRVERATDAGRSPCWLQGQARGHRLAKAIGGIQGRGTVGSTISDARTYPITWTRDGSPGPAERGTPLPLDLESALRAPAMTVNLTRIYTKLGDGGATPLGDMSPVSKLHPRGQAYGRGADVRARIRLAAA